MTMYLYDDLKPERAIDAQHVECPVMGCSHVVPRAIKAWSTRDPESHRCPEHEIYLTPTTFGWRATGRKELPLGNILWTGESDLDILRHALRPGVKRECRMDQERSEDAVTWSVFRGLERTKLIGALLEDTFGGSATDPRVIWWSGAGHDPSLEKTEQGIWAPLCRARHEFETRPSHGSEPDLMILTDETLFIVEAKVGATNVVRCARPEIVRQAYVHGTRSDNEHFSRVFRSTFDEIAVNARLYELMRFWLLGTWMAEQLKRQFCLVSLLSRNDRRECEGDARLAAITERFPQHIRFHEGQRFELLTWEGIHDWCASHAPTSSEAGEVAKYLAQKTSGYTTAKRNGTEVQRLQRAFAIKPSRRGDR